MGDPGVFIGVDDGKEKETWGHLFPPHNMVLSRDW